MTHDFQLEEYKMLRTKAQDTIRRIEDLERNVIIACGGIFVFSIATFKTEHKYQSLILFCLPLGVSLVGFFRYKGLARYMREVNDYTIILEKKLSGKEGGWLTHYYAKEGPDSDSSYQRYREFIWYAVVIFSILAGLILALPFFRNATTNVC